MGGKTQTSTSTVQIPPEVLARYNAVNARAENVAQTPFQAYSSDPNAFVAPMTGTQQQAIGQIGQASTMAQPYFQTGAAATMAGMGPANLGELDVQKYMNPYIQNVAKSTSDLMGQQFGQQMSGQLGNAIQAGAGWGDRSGIAAANLAQQQQLAYGKTMADIFNQGYQQSQGVAQQQQSADLAARQANMARLMQGGQGLAGIGAGAQGSALAGAQALLGAGTQEQQTQQAGLSALYNQFLQERAYPFQVAQFLGNIAMGTGALSGSTTTTTSPAGFFSGFKDGGKVIEGTYRRGGLVPESMGGHVGAEHMGEGYADGGAPPMDYATMVMQQLFGGMDPSAGAYGTKKMGLGAGSYIPSADLPVGQLMVAQPIQAPTQTSASDLVDMASSLGDTAEKGSALWEKYKPRPEFDVKDEDTLYGRLGDASGGAVRPGLAAGGMPYDPQNTGYVPDNSPDKTPELLQPKTPENNQSGGLGDFIKLAMMFIPKANGGGVSDGYADGGYTVSEGDTLWDVAKRHGVSLDELVKMNPQIRDPNRISIGQQINVPQLAQAAGTPTEGYGLRRAAGTPTEGYNRNMPMTPARPEGLAGSMPRAAVALPDDYKFPTAGFGEERYPGSYMSGRSQKNLMDLLKLEAMRRDGVFASGGVAGRSGYLDGGFASDSALAELARKKKEQDILNELSSSDWSGGLGGNQPAPAPAPAPGGLSAGQAALKATGETAPSPLTYSAPEQTGVQEIGQVFLGTQNPTRANETIQSEIVRRGLPGSGGFMADVGDWLTKTSSQISAEAPQRAQTADMMNWYRDNSAYLASNPDALRAAKADPVAYYQTHSGFEGGLIPAGGGYTAGAAMEPKLVPAATGLTYTPTGVKPPVAAAAATSENAPMDLTTGKPVPPTEAKPSDAFGMYSNTAFRDEGLAVNPNDPDGGSLAGFYTYQYGKPLSEVTRDDIIEQQRKWWEGQNGDQIAEKYGPNFAAAYVNLSMLGPKWTKEALAEADGDPNRFFELVKGKLMGLNASDAVKAGWANRVDRASALATGNDTVAADITGGSEAINPAYKAGVSGGANAPATVASAGGLGGANLMDILSGKAPGAENIVLPFLVGLGKMAGSQSRFLGTALLEGIGGGAQAYMDRQTQLADLAQKAAQTRGYDIDNVRKSVQTTDQGDVVWTSQNGVPVPVLLGAYRGMLDSGQVVPPLGFIPTNATEILNNWFEKIGAPKIETGAPKFGEETQQAASSLGIPERTQSTLDRDLRTLSVSPASFRDSQQEISQNFEKTITEAGMAAADQGNFLNQISHQLLTLPDTGVLTGGPLADLQRNALAVYNQTVRLFGEQGAALQIGENEIGTVDAAKKLSAAGILATQSSVGAGTKSAIDMAAMAIPSTELPVGSARKILAGLYVDKTMMLDRLDALNKAKEYVATASPATPGYYLAQNIARDFSAETAAEYAQAKGTMEKILGSYYQAADGTKIPAIDLLLNGMNPAEFDKAFGEGMSRYILNMMR